MLAKQPGTDRLLLFVDQWEEVYTLGDDASVRQAFIGQLLDAAATDAVRVVLTIRGDFMGRALENRTLSRPAAGRPGHRRADDPRRTRRDDRRAGGEDRTRASRRAWSTRSSMTSGDEPGGLPLLEFLLEGLWAERRGGLLTHDAYVRLGACRAPSPTAPRRCSSAA